MRKIILFSLTALAIMACNSNQKSNSQPNPWEQYLVGEWIYETTNDEAAAHYQITLALKADGHMTETEHYTLKTPDDNATADFDGNIFKGKWKLQNDTLAKDGKMSVMMGEPKPGEEPERQEREVKGYTKLLNVTADSLISLDMRGDTIIFVRNH